MVQNNGITNTPGNKEIRMYILNTKYFKNESLHKSGRAAIGERRSPCQLGQKKHRYKNIAEGKLNSQGLSILGWPQCNAKIDDNTNKEYEPRQNTALERSVINDWTALRYFIVH